MTTQMTVGVEVFSILYTKNIVYKVFMDIYCYLTDIKQYIYLYLYLGTLLQFHLILCKVMLEQHLL